MLCYQSKCKKKSKSKPIFQHHFLETFHKDILGSIIIFYYNNNERYDKCIKIVHT